MKTKYPSIFGVLAAVLLVLSFVMPTSLATPAAANPGVCKWDALVTPGYLPLKNDVAADIGLGQVLGYDPNDMAVGGDSNTVLVIAQFWLPDIFPTQIILPDNGVFTNVLFSSSNNGMTFTSTKNTAFQQAYFKEWGVPPATYQTRPSHRTTREDT